jgi:hypothetical protein
MKNDMDRIRADVESWIPVAYELFASEHRLRAQAFLICCGPINGNHLKLFVDNYGLFEEQEKMIEECANQTTAGHKTKCDNDINDLRRARQNNIKLVNN